jgi:hypothetical protein
MLLVRVRNVTKPVVPPQKISIRSADSGEPERTSIQGHAEPSDG